MVDREPAIYLLRHGETEWSATGRHTGRTDVPLTRTGEQQARRAGGTLATLRGTTAPPALVLCSPRSRATRTAELAGLWVSGTSEQLAEWDYGEYEGLTTAEIRKHAEGWTIWSHAAPGGETSHAVTARAEAVLDRARRALGAGDVVLVGHGHFGRVLITNWLSMSPGAGVHFALGPGSTSMLGHERGVPRLDRLNVPPTRP